MKLQREPQRRVRWITPEQLKTLPAELPAHRRDITLFAPATGLRQSRPQRTKKKDFSKAEVLFSSYYVFWLPEQSLLRTVLLRVDLPDGLVKSKGPARRRAVLVA